MKKSLLVFLLISSSLACGQVSYSELKTRAALKRDDFRREYVKHKDIGDTIAQNQVIKEAREFLLKETGVFFKAWYGTQWSFHGHTQTPKKGKIACGYFVTTVLKDMGFNIPRIRWAQLASEEMIGKMTSKLYRFRNKPVSDIEKHIRAEGEGLFVVGLDRHVGFIYYREGKISFVHSNYYQPAKGVMSESLSGKNPLNDSHYRVVGKLFDKEMIENWIFDYAYQ